MIHSAHGSLENRPRLHFCNLRVSYPEPAPTMTEHRIGLPERFNDAVEVRARDVESASKKLRLLAPVRKKLVQWRVEQPDGDR